MAAGVAALGTGHFRIAGAWRGRSGLAARGGEPARTKGRDPDCGNPAADRGQSGATGQHWQTSFPAASRCDSAGSGGRRGERDAAARDFLAGPDAKRGRATAGRQTAGVAGELSLAAIDVDGGVAGSSGAHELHLQHAAGTTGDEGESRKISKAAECAYSGRTRYGAAAAGTRTARRCGPVVRGHQDGNGHVEEGKSGTSSTGSCGQLPAHGRTGAFGNADAFLFAAPADAGRTGIPARGAVVRGRIQQPQQDRGAAEVQRAVPTAAQAGGTGVVPGDSRIAGEYSPPLREPGSGNQRRRAAGGGAHFDSRLWQRDPREDVA